MNENFNVSEVQLVKYEKAYSEGGFWRKVKNVAKKAGAEVVYNALLLFYALKSDKVSLNEKAMIVGALGYFILPVDLIPDFIPALGFTDDAAVLLYLVRTLSCIDDDIKVIAKKKLSEWFGSCETYLY